MKPTHPERLRTAVSDIYRKFGVRDDKSDLLADSLVMADLWGHSSHGVMRTAWYADRMASKAMNADAEPTVFIDTGPLLGIDGHDGIGQHITNHAVDLAATRGRSTVWPALASVDQAISVPRCISQGCLPTEI